MPVLTVRTIIVGDVHGCAAELEELLAQVEWRPEDRLYFVGDLLARGPDSHGVLDIYRRTGARAVLGNHEDRLLEAHRARQAGRPGPRLGPSHRALLSDLTAADWQLLGELPLTLELDDHEVLIVHAGIVPGVPLGQQSRQDLLKMRAIEADGRATSSWRERSWAADYQGPVHVVFGHNAVSGLQLHPWATGLDSGCVYGGRLTALVLSEGMRVPRPDERSECLVSVEARQRYVNFGPHFDKKTASER